MSNYDLNQKGNFIEYATHTVMSIRGMVDNIMILIPMIIVVYYTIYFFMNNDFVLTTAFFFIFLGVIYCLIIIINFEYRPKLKIFEKGFQICTSSENWFLFSPKPLYEKFIPYSDIKNIHITKEDHKHGFYIELLMLETSSGEYIVQNIDNERDINNQDRYNLHPTNIKKIKNILHKHLIEYKEGKGHTAG